MIENKIKEINVIRHEVLNSFYDMKNEYEKTKKENKELRSINAIQGVELDFLKAENKHMGKVLEENKYLKNKLDNLKRMYKSNLNTDEKVIKERFVIKDQGVLAREVNIVIEDILENKKHSIVEEGDYSPHGIDSITQELNRLNKKIEKLEKENQELLDFL